MDPVHDRGSMDPVHESGPWTRSKVGVHGPLVHVLSSPQTTGVRSGSKSSGAKPTRTFLWLGLDTTSSNAQGQVEGKRIKFDKSFNEMEMLSLLKREFKEIGNAR